MISLLFDYTCLLTLVFLPIHTDIKMQMQSAPKTLLDKFKTDDIFTRVIVHHGNSKSHDMNNCKEALQNGKCKILSSWADIFKDKTEKTKSILVVGKRGIGKTLFTKKLINDWSQNGGIFGNTEGEELSSGIKLGYLLMSVQELNLSEDKELSLCDFLRHVTEVNTENNDSNNLVEQVLQNPVSLLLAFDDFDEYKYLQYMNGDKESTFPDDPNTKMPFSALMNKILNKKLAEGCTVVVTARINDINRSVALSRITKLNFDQQVDITALTKPQVLESVEKYFSSKSELKEKALDTVQSSEHFIHFARAPVLSFKMCVYLEKAIEKGAIQLPKSLTELYGNVIESIEKHHNVAILEKSSRGVPDIPRALEMLSELAVKMALDQRNSFLEEDMKKLKLTEAEVSYLKSSSLLYNIPCLSKPKVFEFRFCHQTVQDYFAALGFVRKKETPGRKQGFFARRQLVVVGETVVQFMAGIIDSERDKGLLLKLMKYIGTPIEYTANQRVLTLRCLHDFDNEEFAASLVQKNQQNRFWESDGVIRIYHYTETDCQPVAFLLDIINSLTEKNQIKGKVPPETLYIENSSYMTNDDLGGIFSPLAHSHCPIRKLYMSNFHLDDGYLESLSTHLPATNITDLELCSCKITSNGMVSILKHSDNITSLKLSFNEVSHLEKVSQAQNFYKLRKLDLSYNQLNDDGVMAIIQLWHSLVKLNLSYNCKLSNECKREVRRLCKELYPALEINI